MSLFHKVGFKHYPHLIEYMKSAKQENKMFQFAFSVDGDRRLNIYFGVKLKVLFGTKKMITIGRSDSINAFIKRFVSSHKFLTNFVKHVYFRVQESSQGHMLTNMFITLRPTSLKKSHHMKNKLFESLHYLLSKSFKKKLLE
ncbi:hypothetical protein GQ457_07G008700 [Hibiscus cannabinus]